jgi:hypothetical protein
MPEENGAADHPVIAVSPSTSVHCAFHLRRSHFRVVQRQAADPADSQSAGKRLKAITAEEGRAPTEPEFPISGEPQLTGSIVQKLKD